MTSKPPQPPPPANPDGPQPQPPQDPTKGENGAPQQTGTANFLIALFVAVGMTLFVWQLLFAGKGTLIPYSEFKKELKAGNIEKIQAEGHALWGKFVEKRKIPIPGQRKPREVERWQTVHPQFGDDKLLELIDTLDKKVELRVHHDNSGWLALGLMSLLSIGLVIGFWFYMARRARDDIGGFFNISRSRARTYDAERTTGVTFADVAGIESIKQDVTELVDFLEDPEKYSRLGGTMPKGILLTGPPGTGKTLLARAVAGEAGVPFFSISGSEFIEMFVGVGASRVRDLFEKAKLAGRSIVFIDEIDAVGRTRGTGLGRAHDEREQTLNQMLSEMDGFDSGTAVVVIAATNRPDVLDPALLRPGRFDRQITIPLPTREARRKILEIHARDKPMAEDVDLDVLARGTPGFSGADLANLLNEAAILAARANREATTRQDVEAARDKVMLGNERRDLMRGEDASLRTAIHEAGHALLAVLLPDSDPLHKVTIIPRGRALGVTHTLPEEDRVAASKRQLLDQMTMLLGGRVAEEIHDPTTVWTGGENDFARTHQLARRMVARWGMSERVGPIAYNTETEHPFLGLEVQQARNYSERTAWLIDEEVNRLIGWCFDRARVQLRENRTTLMALADALVEQETLDREEALALCADARYVEVPGPAVDGPFGLPENQDPPSA